MDGKRYADTLLWTSPNVASQTDGSVAHEQSLPHLRLDCLSPGEIVIFLHFMVNFGDEAQLIRSWFGGTHWSQLFCCENPLIGFWPIAGQLKLEEVRSPALWWCSYVFHAMWQTQSIIHNLGRISEEVGINLLNCPLTHSWLQTLPFVGTRTSLSLRPSCRRAGSLDDFGIFFSRKIMTFLKWEIGTQHLGEPSGFEGYGSKVEYGWTNKIGDIFEQTIQFLGQLFWIATKCKTFLNTREMKTMVDVPWALNITGILQNPTI